MYNTEGQNTRRTTQQMMIMTWLPCNQRNTNNANRYTEWCLVALHMRCCFPTCLFHCVVVLSTACTYNRLLITVVRVHVSLFLSFLSICVFHPMSILDRCLLSWQYVESLLKSNSFFAELVIRREASRMSTTGGRTTNTLLFQCVLVTHITVHEVHAGWDAVVMY